ncbi:hypothetical protein N402_04105 [Helicobacter pylori FD423]|nr:hypothetical protein N402_04105 [Helicobacter pylori FD423]
MWNEQAPPSPPKPPKEMGGVKKPFLKSLAKSLAQMRG